MQTENVDHKPSLTWRTSLIFVLLATLIILPVGGLISNEVLPLRQTIEYDAARLRFIQLWIQLAIAIGLVLPTIGFIAWFKRPELRRIFGLYWVLLVIQIVTE